MVTSPTIPDDYVSIDWTQRAQVLNSIATLINTFITTWGSSHAASPVPSPTTGAVFLTPAATLAAYCSTLNAINTELSAGVTAMTVPSGNIDKNNFQSVVNQILAMIRAINVALGPH